VHSRIQSEDLQSSTVLQVFDNQSTSAQRPRENHLREGHQRQDYRGRDLAYYLMLVALPAPNSNSARCSINRSDQTVHLADQ